MIKEVFFDIDGTLQDFRTCDVPQSAQSALWKLHEKGIRVFIASGRPPVHLRVLCSFLQHFPFDGYVLMNGQGCFDAEMKPLWLNPIPKETLHVLVPWLKEQSFPCSVMELDGVYEIRKNPVMEKYLISIGKENMIPEILDPERSYEHDTYQFSPRIPPEMDAEFLKHAPGMKSQRWTVEFPDMICENGGKPAGMQHILDHFGLKKEECMAFGDGGNDISMLEFAAIGVAMGNASEEVKMHADETTTACWEDGVALALKNHHLID